MKYTLTTADFEEILDKLFPVLYYATDSNLQHGNLYYCKEGDYHPEFIVCHPDDLETVRGMITARRLVHIKDEPKEKVIERMLRHLTQRVPDAGDSAASQALSPQSGESTPEVDPAATQRR